MSRGTACGRKAGSSSPEPPGPPGLDRMMPWRSCVAATLDSARCSTPPAGLSQSIGTSRVPHDAPALTSTTSEQGPQETVGATSGAGAAACAVPPTVIAVSPARPRATAPTSAVARERVAFIHQPPEPVRSADFVNVSPHVVLGGRPDPGCG